LIEYFIITHVPRQNPCSLVIENDDYIITFLNSMSVLNTASSDYAERLF
jgi:hypothetical protein